MTYPVLEITARSVWISGTATLLAALWSLPLAYVASRGGRLRALLPFFEALVGVPTVLVGLLLYVLLSREGPFGFLNLLYTPYAIIVGEALLVTPLMTSIAYRVIVEKASLYWELAVSLGATRSQALLTVITQSIPGILSSLIMAFSRALGELGVALLVGGNIKGYTRTLTTSIALEVSMGDLHGAVELGIVLLAIVTSLSAAARLIEKAWGSRIWRVL